MIEPASSGRAKCRSCDQAIAKGELRFGERQPNAFGEGEMTLWFHLPCAAYSRPEPFLEAQGAAPADAGEDAGSATTQGEVAGPELEALAVAARFGIEHRRVPRLHGAERATSGRAHCRSCRELIAKGALGGLVLETEDARALYETLKERGVTDFTQEPTDHFYGTDMGVRDPFGNAIRILERKAAPKVTA